MGVQSFKIETPNVDTYIVDATPETNSFVPENENEIPAHSSVIQTGWAAAKKAVDKSKETFTTDFRFTEEPQLIKFISSDPMSFMQHWINRTGKKSFISIGEGDPLIAVGSKPDQKFAFTVVNFSAEAPQLQLMIVGVRLCTQLEKLANSKITGPLNRPDMYFSVCKSGVGLKTIYTITAVKERDIADEWQLDPVKLAEFVRPMKPLGTEALHTSSKAELQEIAREIASSL